MEILGIGTSSHQSIVYHIGEHRRVLGDDVVYASRSCPFGYKLDVTDIATLQQLFDTERPEVVILAVGSALKSPSFNSFDDWQRQCDDIAARTQGTLATMIAANIVGSVNHFIVLGGREAFEDRSLGAYGVSNGGAWGAVQHAMRHASYKSNYVSMPFVTGSANAETLARAGLHTVTERANAISVPKVIQTVDDIIADRIEPGRVML